MRQKAISINNLSKKFGSFQLDIPELQLERGVVLGLVGQNGAGKSTLIKILMNLVYPDKGQVAILGMQHPQDEVAIRERIGYVSENPNYYEEMSISALAKMISSFYPRWQWGLYDKYLHRFELDPNKRVKQLSKGMKVKLGVMLALAHQPELLILDEPTSGVDPVMRRELLEEIVAVLQDEQKTVLFSSHITQDIEQIADYVAILEGGKLYEFNDRETLFDRWKRISGKTKSPEALRPFFVQFQIEGTSFNGITNRYSSDLISQLRQTTDGVLDVLEVNLEQILLSVAKKGVAARVGISS